MNKLLLSATFLTASICVSAQSIVTTTPQHVSAVLEEYTGIHCTFCPDGHKIASEIKSDYPSQVVLVNIHTGGYANPSAGEPDFRTAFGPSLATQTNLGGYPSGTVSRHIFTDLASDMALNRGSWKTAAEAIFNEVSPVTVGASTTYDAATRTITIDVEAYYTDNASMSTNRLNIALLQDSVPGPQVGGSTYNPTNIVNGQYMHGHMLRDLITGQWGATINTTSQGSLYTNTYSYVIPNDVNGVVIDPNHCHLAIYVSEDQTEVLHGITLGIDGDTHDGSTSPIYGTYANLSQAVVDGTPSTASSFNFDFTSTTSGSNDFIFELDADAPANWSADFKVDQSTYTSGQTHTINLAGGNANSVSIDITPGATAAVGQFTLTAKLASDPNFVITQEVYLVSGVTDLVVNGSGGFGNSQTYNWEQVYLDGLTNAGNSSNDATTAGVMRDALDAGALAGVNNIYLNIGWTFPSLSDNETNALTSFMDNGGNVLIAGQDIGWDINDANGNGTTITKDFYTSYLKAVYKGDGSAANNQLDAVTTDGVFGSVTSSTIVDKYNGNIFPDEMDPSNGAEAIFYYNGNSAKVGGIRFHGAYKSVFLGVGLEMIQDAAVQNEIVKLSYQWFNGIISLDEFDLGMRKISAFPNPSKDWISLDNLKENMNYEVSITNVSGQEVMHSSETSSNGTLKININTLPQGAYLINLKNDKETISSSIVKQ